MSFARPKVTRTASPSLSIRGSPVASSRPQTAAREQLNSLPTADLLELKRSIDERLAERREYRGTRSDEGWDREASQVTIEYGSRPSSSYQQRASPVVSRAGSRPGTPDRVLPRPMSAGSSRPISPYEQRTKRPVTPTLRYSERLVADVDRMEPSQRTRMERGRGGGWREGEERGGGGGGFEDVDIFSNDRRAISTLGTMIRPHSARVPTVTGKVGAASFGVTPVKILPRPPKAGAFKVRKDLMRGVTLLRRFYDRGDLPISVRHCPQENEINWKVEVEKLDYHYYLPIFFDGLRDKEEPYFFFARRGILDMVSHGSDRVVPVLPQLIIFIKNALNTRDPDVVQTTLKILQTMVQADQRIGEALVPYYRQLLPVFNLLKSKNKNSGDSIDYSQRKRTNVSCRMRGRSRRRGVCCDSVSDWGADQ